MEADDNSKTSVEITTSGVTLVGDLVFTLRATGIVLFAHGSGSSRFSPRNHFVAKELHKARLATLLMDLLTQEEEMLDEQTRALRFNIEMLAQRLVGAVDWLRNEPQTKDIPVGLFGASTGAAAALVAAAERPEEVLAVVSRGGRPDLAAPVLSRVRAPTLLIVGGNDTPVIRMNWDAYDLLQTQKEVAIVPGATHLFEEPGTLEEVARLAMEWFQHYLGQCEQKAAA